MNYGGELFIEGLEKVREGKLEGVLFNKGNFGTIKE